MREERTPAGITSGRPVFTIDGHRIGSVKEVQGNFLKIDAPLQRDYWLSCEDLEKIEGESVVMSFDDAELDEHKLPVPGDAQEDRGAQTPYAGSGGLVRPVINEDDEERQRDEIERQMAVQARSLDPSALHTQHEVPGAAPTDAPESERTRGELLPLEALMARRGQQLVDANGEEIGPISEIYYDEASRQPEWIGADAAGVLGTRRVVAPVRGSYVLDGNVSVPYTRQQVLDSGAGDVVITVAREQELYRHYGLPYSQDASPTGLPEGVEPDTAPKDERRAPSSFTSQDVRGGIRSIPETDMPGRSPNMAPMSNDPADGGDLEAQAIEDISLEAAMGMEPIEDVVADNVSNIAAQPTPAKPGDAMPSLGEEAPAYTPRSQDTVDPRYAGITGLEAPHLATPIDDMAGMFARRVAAGAAGGLIAAVPIMIGRGVMHRRMHHAHVIDAPEIIEKIAHVAKLDRAVAHDEGRPRMHVLGHALRETAGGAVYGALPGGPGVAVPKGAAFGAAVWGVRYMGWVPGGGLRGHSRKHNAIALAVSVLWGVVTAMIAARLSGERGNVEDEVVRDW